MTPQNQKVTGQGNAPVVKVYSTAYRHTTIKVEEAAKGRFHVYRTQNWSAGLVEEKIVGWNLDRVNALALVKALRQIEAILRKEGK
jgi:hypothetical protein